MVVAKMEAGAKVSRREIATLIEKGRLETARIRVENIISEDLHIELLEIIDLYCEVLTARINLIDVSQAVDPGIAEAVAGIVYAAPRTEVKELHQLREILMNRYGRDYAIQVMENRNNIVPLRVTSKINVSTPNPQLVELYLNEIAKAYKLPLPFKLSEQDSVNPDPPDTSVESESLAALEAESAKSKPILKPRRPTVSFKDVSQEVLLDRDIKRSQRAETSTTKVTTPPDREIPKRDMNYSGGSTVRSFSTAHSRASTFADTSEGSGPLKPEDESSATNRAVEKLIHKTQRHLASEPEKDVDFDELAKRLAALKGMG